MPTETKSDEAASVSPWTSERFGLLCGATMAVGAAVSFAVARAGFVGGLAVEDIILVRYVVAGLALLPLLLWWGAGSLAGIGWRRGLWLLLLGGPLFSMLQTGGFLFAPLAHGGVIAPSAVTIFSTIIAGVFLRERITLAHVLGAAIVLLGIMLIGWDGLTRSSHGQAWIGDLMFVGSSAMWATYSVLVRHWRLDAARSTAAVAVLSMVSFLPAYLAWHGLSRVMELPGEQLILQGLVQGGLQGVITIIAYTRAINLLGVSRAVLFPAIVPAISLLVGVPIVGEIPHPLQITGLLLVTLGLLTAIGVVRRLLPR